MTATPFILLDDSLTATPSGASGRTLLFEDPERVIAVYRPEDVEAGLDIVTDGLSRGLHATGFFAYELGYCLEPKLQSLLPRDRRQPLFWIGLYREPVRFTDAETRGWLDANGALERSTISDLQLSWTRDEYTDAFAKVQDYIAAGDVYQINLTLKYRFAFSGDPVALYSALRRKQRVEYGALIGASDFQGALSLSPELFFSREGKHLTSRPMKGTAPRGADAARDRKAALELAVDEKQRAENLMIVDLLRNDLSRISRIGSVHVPRLFQVETYPTLHQMTSTVVAELLPSVGLHDLFAALFPCGSVTGAPKIRAMEIIRELEATPRGVYCGAIGWIAPSGDMSFNVAIRTLFIDPTGRARWASAPASSPILTPTPNSTSAC